MKSFEKREINEREAIADELSSLANEIDKNPKARSYDEFINHLKYEGFDKFPRESSLGSFLRASRFEEISQEAASRYGIPVEYLVALQMTESYGDPIGFNSRDGGVGIGHFQLDVAKLDFGMKVFTDHPDYQHISIRDYAGQAKVLREEILPKYKYDLHKLAEIDDRFNPEIAIPKMAEFLSRIKKHIDKRNDRDTSAQGRAEIKQDVANDGQDFTWLLACNGYNKGPKNYYKEFVPYGIGDTSAPNHVTHLRRNVAKYNQYSTLIKQGIAAGMSTDQILESLRTGGIAIEREQTVKKVVVQQQKELAESLTSNTPKEVLPEIYKATPKKAAEKISGIEDTSYQIDFEPLKNRSKDGNFAIYKGTFLSGERLLSPEEIAFMFAKKYSVDKALVMITDKKGVPLEAILDAGDIFYIKYLDCIGNYRDLLSEHENTFVHLYRGENTEVYGFKPDVWFTNWTVGEIRKEFQDRYEQETGQHIPLESIQAMDVLGTHEYRDEKVVIEKDDEDMLFNTTDINKIFLHVAGSRPIDQLQ